jgi:hypothetical protein
MAPRKRNRDFILLALFALLVVAGAFGVWIVLSRSRGTPKLFHSAIRVPALPIRVWELLPPIEDQHGSVAWSDLQWNFVVLIITNDPALGGALTPHEPTADSATLLSASSWQTKVTAQRDTLLVINATGATQSFPIPLDGSVRVAGLKPLQDQITLTQELRQLIPADDLATYDPFVAARLANQTPRDESQPIEPPAQSPPDSAAAPP